MSQSPTRRTRAAVCGIALLAMLLAAVAVEPAVPADQTDLLLQKTDNSDAALVADQVCPSMAEMTVRKVVVNPAGDPDAGRQFEFTPNPAAPWLPTGQTTFVLAHDQTRSTCTDSTTDDYTVTETTDPLHTTTSACAGDIDPQNRVSSASGTQVIFRPGPIQGEILECTFTNTRKTGTLRVGKVLAPTSDPGKFDLQIDGMTRLANAGHGQGITITVETGNHDVGEVAGTGTSLSDYTSQIECVDAQGGPVKSGTGTSLRDIAVGEGDQITCTITNTRQPPTYVAVTSATARRGTGGVTIAWRTSSEIGVLGFNVWRGVKGRFAKLNRTLIPARPGAAGANYRYVDRSALPHRAYVYLLEAVGLNGARRMLSAVRLPAR